MDFQPSYLKLYQSGELRKRTEIFRKKLEHCDLCPHNCGVNRLKNEKGFCGAGPAMVVSLADLHFGEEPVISGSAASAEASSFVKASDDKSASQAAYAKASASQGGSGTIFFSFCNLRCVFCQNYKISQLHQGEKISAEKLAEMMLDLERRGAHNINMVSPSHFLPQIMGAMVIAIPRGLTLPLILNSNGYESPETLKLLDGLIDIYLPDIKYGDDDTAFKYSQIKNYTRYNQAALKEMYRQVGGEPIINDEGIMERGLIVRHLVLPNDLANSEKCFQFLARELSPDVYVSLMAQYTPVFKAKDYPLLSRRLTAKEYDGTARIFHQAGLKNGWIQELESAGESHIPDF